MIAFDPPKPVRMQPRARLLHVVFGVFAVLSLLWLLLAQAGIAQAGGVVTTCDDAHFTGALAGGGSVTFSCGPATVALASTKTITLNTTINGGNLITLSGGGVRQLFVVNSGATLTLTNVTIRDGYSSGNDGGAVYVNSGATLSVIGSRFYSNTTAVTFSGGAILTYGRLTIDNSEFAYNKSGGGGAVYPRWGAVAAIHNSSFHHNEADSTSGGWGGAMLLWDGPQVTVDSGTTFISNTAQSGGAIFVLANSALTLTNVMVGSNRAITPTGGGLEIAGRAFIANSQFISNTANVGGGGINVESGAVLNMVNGRIELNKAYHANDLTQGAGIRNAGTLLMTGTVIANNTASVGLHGSRGGGLYQAAGTLALSNVSVQGNHAIHGAGVNGEDGSVYINGSTFTQNFAESGDGGGLRTFAVTTSILNSTFSGNYAVFSGGGIAGGRTLMLTDTQILANGAYNSGGGMINYGTATLTRVTLNGNNAQGGGEGFGGAIANGGTLTLRRATVSGNYANEDGGGIFNNGTAYVISTTVSNNIANGGDEVQAGHGGGGIMNSGLGASISLQDSTLSGNKTNQRDGGAVYNLNGFLYALNTTFSGNRAPGWGGGLMSNFAFASLIHATFSGNAAAAGGGIYQLTTWTTRTVSLQNTLIANSPSGMNCDQFAGSLDVQSGGYNLSDDNSLAGAGFCAGFQANDFSNADDKLGSLANYGGPTLMHLPLPGSAAIDKIPQGTSYCGLQYPTDQRGRTRPVNGDADPAAKCDIGAVEYTPGDVWPMLYLPLIRR